MSGWEKLVLHIKAMVVILNDNAPSSLFESHSPGWSKESHIITVMLSGETYFVLLIFDGKATDDWFLFFQD